MEAARKISITLRGKTYVISTSEQESQVTEAANTLDATMRHLENAGGLKRDDQLALFSALQALVSVIKERDELKNAIEHDSEILSSLLDQALI